MPTLLHVPDVSRSSLARLDGVCKVFIAEAMQGGLRPRRRGRWVKKRFPPPSLPHITAPSLQTDLLEAEAAEDSRDELLGPSSCDTDSGLCAQQSIEYAGLWPRLEPGCTRFPPLSLPSTWMLLSLEADRMMRSTSSFGSVSSRSTRRSPRRQQHQEKPESAREARAKDLHSDPKRPSPLRISAEGFLDDEGPNSDLSGGSAAARATQPQGSPQSVEAGDRQNSRPSVVRAAGEEGSSLEPRSDFSLQDLVSPDSEGGAARWGRQVSPSDFTPKSQDKSLRQSRFTEARSGVDSLSPLNPQSVQSTPAGGYDRAYTRSIYQSTRSLDKELGGEADLEEAAHVTFNSLKDPSEVHRLDLPLALERLGFVSPKQSWIDEIFQQISPQYNTIELDDFVAFIKRYATYRDEAYAAAFASCDKDGSGLVEVKEVADLLRDFDVQPMTHVLQEVIDEVDEDRGGTLDLDEFKELLDLLLLREGFTASEYEEFIGIFSRYDRDESGELDSKEFQTILNWLGFAWTADRTQAVISQVDTEGNGLLNQRQYLLCMRKVREAELELLQRLIAENDVDQSGTTNMSEVVPVLKDLGYEMWDISAIHEAAEDAGVETIEMDLSALWRLLLTYRMREGFCNVDLEQIDTAFRGQDQEGSGQLPALEATRALRELGFTAGFHVMQSVLNKVDVDDTGTLDKAEFRKMVRMLQERDIQRYKKAFWAAVGRDSKVGTLDEHAAAKAVHELGFRVRHQYLALAAKVCAKSYKMAEPFIDSAAFVRVCCRHARDMRQVFKSNGGWTEGEVTQLKTVFNKYDVKKKGVLSSNELVRMVEDMFPVLARDRRMRPDLQRIMKEALHESARAEGVAFKDFLRLMQLFREFQDGQRLHKEQQAVHTTGFTSSEVAQFRDLFILAANASHQSSLPAELSFDQFRAMMHDLTPLGDALTLELKEIFYKFTRRISGEVRSKRSIEDADFPEFLMMMKHMLDVNFAKIKDKTNKPKPVKAPPAKADRSASGGRKAPES